MDTKDSSIVIFKYRFKFEDLTEKEFTIKLDADSLYIIAPEKKSPPPDWTILTNSQCENCPLKSEESKYCPIAVNLTDLLNFFASIDSYDRTYVEIEAPERMYCKQTTVQRGLGSMLGIYMVTCGCPVMDVLKPMVRFHLPFATIEETVFRSIGSYLIGQYFYSTKELPADFTLDKLREFYIQIQKVNLGIIQRLKPVIKKDAIANAVITLDAFAKELPWSIEDHLKELEYLYRGFFE